MFRQFLILCSVGIATTAMADCEKPAACADDYVFDSQATQDYLEPWLSFTVAPDAMPLSYGTDPGADFFTLDEVLSFALPAIASNLAGTGRRETLNVDAVSEPAFALLLGKVARLHADGSMVLGRGDERSNSPADYGPGYWDDLLPAAFYEWNERLDIDLGLSYADEERFSTSLGFAEKIGNQNNDPAVVGWFEYRF